MKKVVELFAGIGSQTQALKKVVQMIINVIWSIVEFFMYLAAVVIVAIRKFDSQQPRGGLRNEDITNG